MLLFPPHTTDWLTRLHLQQLLNKQLLGLSTLPEAFHMQFGLTGIHHLLHLLHLPDPLRALVYVFHLPDEMFRSPDPFQFDAPSHLPKSWMLQLQLQDVSPL